MFKILLTQFILIGLLFSNAVALDSQQIVNDISGLNPVKVAKIIQPKTTLEIINTIKNSNGKISIGGARHSMGGQISYPNSLHIDMRLFNKIIDFDKKQRTITVQSGATWRDIQSHIDADNLSISVMQSYANFTLGGSLSVNAHGRYVGKGALIESVLSFKIVLASGEQIFVSRRKNPKLFYGAIGGYGGLGVITEVRLKLAKNTKIQRQTQLLKTSNYAQYFHQNIKNNTDIIFNNGNLYPPKYAQIRNISWRQTDKDLTVTDRLVPQNKNYFWSKNVINFIADYQIGKVIKKNIIDPIRYYFNPVVWRNYEASLDVGELPENTQNQIYGLREYFIPVAKFDVFINAMKNIFTSNQVNVINVSVRYSKSSPKNLLSWAKNEVFSFVVYYRQKTDKNAIAKVKKWSLEMIDASLKVGGSYYLPYQIFATNEQFNLAYPRAKNFFELKQKVDPNNRFRNKLWEKYYINPVLK